ncbi:hypothetical protein BDK51DRAFT_42453 [Blyttiomyces helicus]|uniref:Uncharacterized protein n=1 Tax=Blyttiomyces helicus TaxID=388810 RepID=A0A4P9WRX0_9FUNG|nr:hypothetical protein BDK51DRAFT_42453 [Blyttiomyces helicus]|eukprot:RKO93696.1 hypothetical protein BDK51DRAFT_42453 [Blyttiomyces helicus]
MIKKVEYYGISESVEYKGPVDFLVGHTYKARSTAKRTHSDATLIVLQVKRRTVALRTLVAFFAISKMRREAGVHTGPTGPIVMACNGFLDMGAQKELAHCDEEADGVEDVPDVDLSCIDSMVDHLSNNELAQSLATPPRRSSFALSTLRALPGKARLAPMIKYRRGVPELFARCDINAKEYEEV